MIKNIGRSHRWRQLILVFSFFIIAVFPLHGKEKIKGFFYLDHQPVLIEIEHGKIAAISRLEELPEGSSRIYIAPGFIDNQVNGFAGVTFALGGGKLTLEDVKKVTEELWKLGVTSYLPTLTTNSRQLLLHNLSVLKNAKDDPGLHGSVLGFHLEGPFISPDEGYRGAHPKKHVRKPDWDEFMEYHRASGDNIVQVTLAPEMEGALDFISNCRKNDIVVALGHHNAFSETITAAIDLGARIATHIGNGAANMINRHYNPFWPQLADDRLMISIICDGFHLLPEEIKTFYKVKGVEKTIITSDVTGYGGLPAGRYTTAEGDPIEITPEGMLRNIAQNGLYGSASPILKGVGHIMKVTGCSLNEAFKMASTNPARLYGLKDRGEIKPGMRADLILFTLDNFNIKIHQTIVAGKVVYTSH